MKILHYNMFYVEHFLIEIWENILQYFCGVLDKFCIFVIDLEDTHVY